MEKKVNENPIIEIKVTVKEVRDMIEERLRNSHFITIDKKWKKCFMNSKLLSKTRILSRYLKPKIIQRIKKY